VTASFSPEFRLLVGCCTWPASEARDAAIRAMVRDGVSWPALMRLVRRHRVAAMVYAALTGAGADIPPEQARELIARMLGTKQQNHRSAAETVRLQKSLDAAGIPAIFFKGATLAQVLYGSLDLKHSKDIDVLVPPEHAPAAVRLLEESGYRLWFPQARLTPAQWRQCLYLHKETVMVAPGRGLQVEPHWRLIKHPRAFPHVDARSRTREVDLPGFGAARTLEPTALFAYLCAHGTEHGWVRLKWLADVHAWLAPLAPHEIEQLYAEAKPVAGEIPLLVAFALCQRVYGMALPPAVARDLAPDRAASKWASEIVEISLAALLGDAEEQGWREDARLHLMLARAHGYLASYLWRRLVGGAEAIAYPLPRWLHVLYLPARLPLALWRRLTGQGPYPPFPPAEP